MSESKTPMTDIHSELMRSAKDTDVLTPKPWPDFARTLETELSEAKAEIELLKEYEWKYKELCK